MKTWSGITGMLAISLLTGSLAFGGAAGLNWQTDLAKAQAQAKREKKIVMLDFTGSDWCVFCAKLDKEIFATPDFKSYAARNLVLVEADFPRRKKQSDAVRKANAALQEKYGIKGYPTLVLLDGDGKKLGQMGYQTGGPKPFLKRLDEIRKKAG